MSASCIPVHYVAQCSYRTHSRVFTLEASPSPSGRCNVEILKDRKSFRSIGRLWEGFSTERTTFCTAPNESSTNPAIFPRLIVRSVSQSKHTHFTDGSSDQSDDEQRSTTVLQFVNWFREAWPYIQGHRGSTFVLVIPGEIIANAKVTGNILQDVALLHGLGVRIVIVPGCHRQIDELLEERGFSSNFHGAYRVTDAEALEAAMESAGRIRVDIEAKLSRGPSIPVLRRHGETDRWHDVGISVASGNFVAAKRRGVVDGVDFGATGEVKKVDVSRIAERLEQNCIVLLSNLGYSAAGEVLNCNTYEVATACATALHADKLLLLLDGPIHDSSGRLIRWMTLQEADRLIRQRASQSYTAGDYVRAVAGDSYARSLGLSVAPAQPQSTAAKSGLERSATNGKADEPQEGMPDGSPDVVRSEVDLDEEAASIARWNAQRALYSMPFEQVPAVTSQAALTAASREFSTAAKVSNGLAPGGRQTAKDAPQMGFAIGGEERHSRTYGYMSELTAAVYACRNGVRRVHLLNSFIEGVLLLELYTRDGISTMVSSDLYEGTRAAQASDVPAIGTLLEPLTEAGVLVHRSPAQLLKELPFFTVVERDGSLIACAALYPFPDDKCGEVAAFAVSPEARGHGRGDNLLDYLERRAVEMGLDNIFLLTTRTADWFVHRGFQPCPLEALPEERQNRINRSRGSKSFMKDVQVAAAERLAGLGTSIPTDLPKYGS